MAKTKHDGTAAEAQAAPGQTPAVLIVDDDKTHRFTLKSLIGQWGWRCVEADDGDTAVAAVEKHRYAAVLMDIRMARLDGRAAFARIHALRPELPVLLMTAYSTVDDAVAMMKEGVFDYLTKPLDFDRLRLALTRACTLSTGNGAGEKEEKSGDNATCHGIIGESPAINDLLEMIARVAPTEATVLIHGESGTGKELIADALHLGSPRAKGPLVKVNCAALAETLLESELFGHEKGAFTGADRQRDGKFMQASGGTLFLDEIGETSPAMQVKLLRALQQREIQRVGGEATIRVDVRVIAASNRDLEREAHNGNFREDLYYRLNVVQLEAPPLRERAGDIPLLVKHFVAQFAARNHRVVEEISDECLRRLVVYPWPGNVRELENAIERGVILMQGNNLTEKSLPLTIQRYQADGEASADALPQGGDLLSEAERRLILQTLAVTNGNKSEAARRLGITRKTLHNKLERYEQEE
ncbi:MAG: sigma-54 dependent transcriptional regulator [Desulfobulbaceae bacterium]|jgi:two-component system response regulator HydG|nr:sigma-54 dependent transcriptional regulator [Desulfobulbaceae bacterium]